MPAPFFRAGHVSFGAPFNPLRYLRLSIACGNRPDAVSAIYAHLWTTGGDPDDAPGFLRLAESLGVRDEASLNTQSVKDTLRQNTERAAAAGVFGVPTYAVDGELFWGADALEFVTTYLANPMILQNAETTRLDSLPVGAARK